MSAPRVAFAGLTHLGLCSALAAAQKGFHTLAFDPDGALVARLAAGDLPVAEPGLDGLLRENRERLTFTADPHRLATCDLVYVACDVPTDESGGSDLAAVDALLACVLAHAQADATLVVLSQVPPGFTRARQPAGRSLHCQVETLVIGRAVERALQPERIILGCPDPAAALPGALHRYLAAFGCPVLPMSLESAELAKIAINCCLAASVGVANTLAGLCEKIGADWSQIATALRLDRRIGPHAYLVPGLGLSGGNIERDLATVMGLSAEHGTDASIVGALLAASAHRKDWALRVLHEALLSRAPQARLAILGLAYKENTDSVRNSPALALIAHLTPWPLQVFDPLVPAAAAPHPQVTGARSPLEAVQGADAVAIMTPWPQFRALAAAELAAAMRGRLLLDPYRVIDPAAARAAGLDYRTLGAP